MVNVSTIVILIGIVFLFIPLPPVATILGILTILLGVIMRVVFDL